MSADPYQPVYPPQPYYPPQVGCCDNSWCYPPKHDDSSFNVIYWFGKDKCCDSSRRFVTIKKECDANLLILCLQKGWRFVCVVPTPVYADDKCKAVECDGTTGLIVDKCNCKSDSLGQRVSVCYDGHLSGISFCITVRRKICKPHYCPPPCPPLCPPLNPCNPCGPIINPCEQPLQPAYVPPYGQQSSYNPNYTAGVKDPFNGKLDKATTAPVFIGGRAINMGSTKPCGTGNCGSK